MKPLILLSILAQTQTFVSAWSFTEYQGFATTSGPQYLGWTTLSGKVCPTGPIPDPTATSTSVGSVQLSVLNSLGFERGASVILPATTTYLDLPSNASVTFANSNVFGEHYCDTATSTQNTQLNQKTNFYAPAIISNPPSCTLTSFLYTTTYSVELGALALVSQAMAPPIAQLVTEITSVISTDLGGQAVKSTYTAVYLSKDALGSDGLSVRPNEDSYLSECVDPRRYLCHDNFASLRPSDIIVSPGSCSVSPFTYPPVSITGGGKTMATATATASGSQNRENDATKERHVDLGLVGVSVTLTLLILG